MTKTNECKLIIFDLDGTLHEHHNKKQELQKHIPEILAKLKKSGKILVIASLNSNADNILYQYNISQFFDKIYCKNWMFYGDFKTDMFIQIRRDFNIEYENMLFFDDNIKYCLEADTLHIKSILVNNTTLLQQDDISRGLNDFIQGSHSF